MAVPEAPTRLRTKRIGNFVLFEWDAVPTATHYIVSRWSTGTGWVTQPGKHATTENYWHDWDVSENTEYTYLVRAWNSDGYGAWASFSAAPKIEVGGWSGDKDFTLTLSLDNGKPHIDVTPYVYTWNNVGTLGYDIFRRELGKPQTATWLGIRIPHSNHGTRRYRDASAEDGKTYQYVAVAVSNNNQKRFFAGPEQITVPTSVVAPGLPNITRAVADSSSQITFSWTAPLSGSAVTRYEVEYKPASSSTWKASADDVSPVIFGSLAASTSYDFRVRAHNAGGSSDWLTTARTTSAVRVAAPGPPTSVTARALDHRIIRVSWSRPTSGGTPTRYIIESRNQEEATWHTQESRTTYVNLGPRNPSTTVVYRVKSRNSAGDSSWSSTKTATTNAPATPAPATPSKPSFTGGSQTTLIVAWTNVSGATSYNLRYKPSASRVWTRTIANVNSPLTISGLQTGTNYDIQVQAKNSSGSSNWSATLTASTSSPLSLPDIGWRAPTRLRSIADLQKIFTRVSGSKTGAWVTDSGGSTATVNTGPGTNSDGPYVHSEATRGHWQDTVNQVQNNSLLLVKPSQMAAWVGNGRKLLVRVCVQGSGWTALNEGFNISGRAGSGSWIHIALILGWSYSDGYKAGDILTDAAGIGHVVQQDGGWVDFAVDIPNGYTEVRAYSRLWALEPRVKYHDLALWQVELQNGVIDTAVESDSGAPSAPIRFQADSQSTGTVMTWLQPKNVGKDGIAGYNIWRHNGHSWTEIVRSTGNTDLTYTDTEHLTDGAHYGYAIRALNSEGNGEWSQVIGVLINPSLPSAPRELTGDAQSSGVELDWLTPVDAGTGGAITGYNIQRLDGSIWTELEVDTASTDTSYTDSTPSTEGKTAHYKVRARNGAGAGEWSDVITVIINPSRPSAPRRVTADAQSSGVALDWLAPVDAGTGGAISGYEIWRHDGISWSEVEADTGSTGTSYTDTDTLTDGKTYQYAIRARNGAGGGEWSAAINVIINPQLASAPRRLTAILTTAGVKLTWIAPKDAGAGGAIAGYSLFRSADGLTWTLLHATTSASTLTYTDAAPPTQGMHSYAVRARNPKGLGEWSNSTSLALDTGSGAGAGTASPRRPSAPRRVVVLETTGGNKITWLAPANSGTEGSVRNYTVYRYDGSSWTRIKYTAASTRQHVDTNKLTAGKIYYYVVRAINDDGEGEWSETASVLVGGVAIGDVAGPARPSAPRRLAVVETDSGNTLTWIQPADSGTGGAVSSYNAYRYDGSSWKKIGTTAASARRHVDTDSLVAGKTYYYVVRAVNADGEGEWSETTGVTTASESTLSTTPSAPRRVTGDAQSSGIVLDWLAPAHAGTGGAVSGYEIWRWHGGVWSEIEADTGSLALTYTDTDTLVAGQTYWYSLRAINAEGKGEWSEKAGVTTASESTLSTTPSAPRRFTADARSTGVVLDWLAPVHAGTGGAISGYNLWRWHGGVWSEIEADTGSLALTYTDTDTLVDGQTYWYSLRAINADGGGEWSEKAGAVINPSLPSAPRRFTADARSTGVVLDWLAPVDAGTGGAVSGYNIWRWHGGVWSEIEADTGSLALTYTDTDTLVDGQTYWYTLRAINAEGKGEWSEKAGAVINPSLPSAPRRLVVAETASGVMLEWLAPIDNGTGGAISGYNLWRWHAGVWSEIEADTGSPALTYTDTATLAPGWHFWSVRAINASGGGEWSNPAGVTTATDVPGPPASLYAIEVATGVQLAWTAPLKDGGSAIIGYRIWRSDGITWTEIQTDTGGTGTTYTDTAVSAAGDGIYFYRVSAITANGPGDFSAAASVQLGAQTGGTAEAPTGLVALDGALGAIELSWVVPFSLGTGTHTGYRIECWRPRTQWSLCVEDTESTTTSHTLARAVATGVNLFRVAAITDAGVGEWSLPASIWVDVLFGPAGGRKTLGSTSFYAPTLIAPPAVRYPVTLRDRNGYNALWSGLYEAQAEWVSWTSQGGSDSATVQVAAVSKPALRHALDWLGHDVRILQPGTQQVLWSGYVNSVTVPIGNFGLRRSMEGYANDLRVKWTRPANEFGGAVDFVHSAVNPQAGWQQARFGVRSVLVKSDQTLVELDQDDVDRLLAEYQESRGTARMEGEAPAGARLECRGHAGILDQRFFPTRAAGQYGSVTTSEDGDPERIQYEVNDDTHDAIFQYADLNPRAGHGPLAPSWDQYLRRVRLWQVSRFGSGTKQKFEFGVYGIGGNATPGAELATARVVVGRDTPYNSVPLSPSKAPLVIDWMADGDPLTKLPAAGWYFGLVDQSDHHESGFLFDRSKSRYWSKGTNNRWLMLRRGKQDTYRAYVHHLCFDYFTGVTAQGLVEWMATDAKMAKGVFGAHPVNAAAGVYGAQVTQYYEGDTTWRSAVDQLSYADRLCYAIDEQKLMRFWSADAGDAEPLEWTGGGANLGSFIGRRIKVEGNEFLMLGASYDFLTGQVDFSAPGKPSATVAGARLGDVR